ncbi:UNVERIFIED_CONTAM: hypothetical protein GTU68_042758 [Idotea baltica]|nr:hypothetical protein [Idotea baltica]
MQKSLLLLTVKAQVLLAFSNYKL